MEQAHGGSVWFVIESIAPHIERSMLAGKE
jgi:hypothetical protein